MEFSDRSTQRSSWMYYQASADVGGAGTPMADTAVPSFHAAPVWMPSSTGRAIETPSSSLFIQPRNTAISASSVVGAGRRDPSTLAADMNRTLRSKIQRLKARKRASQQRQRELALSKNSYSNKTTEPVETTVSSVVPAQSEALEDSKENELPRDVNTVNEECFEKASSTHEQGVKASELPQNSLVDNECSVPLEQEEIPLRTMSVEEMDGVLPTRAAPTAEDPPSISTSLHDEQLPLETRTVVSEPEAVDSPSLADRIRQRLEASQVLRSQFQDQVSKLTEGARQQVSSATPLFRQAANQIFNQVSGLTNSVGQEEQEYLRQQVLPELGCAAGTALFISPLVRIMDKTTSSSLQVVRGGTIGSIHTTGMGVTTAPPPREWIKNMALATREMLLSPKLFFMGKPFALTFAVSFGTFAAVNLAEMALNDSYHRKMREESMVSSFPESKNSALPVVAATFANVPFLAWKRQQNRALLLRGEQPIGGAAAGFKTQSQARTPLRSLGLFGVRDFATLFSTFYLAPKMANYMVHNHGVDRNTASLSCSLAVPTAMQIMTTPLHIHANDYVHRPMASLSSSLTALKRDFSTVALARGLHALPAFGLGSYTNQMLREHVLPQFRSTTSPVSTPSPSSRSVNIFTMETQRREPVMSRPSRAYA